jgi:hypothetical protein
MATKTALIIMLDTLVIFVLVLVVWLSAAEARYFE